LPRCGEVVLACRGSAQAIARSAGSGLFEHDGRDVLVADEFVEGREVGGEGCFEGLQLGVDLRGELFV